MNLTWQIKSFQELSPGELYAIFHLRAKVFVVEQKCIFNDVDGKDEMSHHVFAFSTDIHSAKHKHPHIFAYARIVPPHISYKELSIGRVCTDISVRKTGLGTELMDKCMYFIRKNYPKQPIRIGAQSYLRQFYENYGFIKDSDKYIEDDILHMEMICYNT